MKKKIWYYVYFSVKNAKTKKITNIKGLVEATSPLGAKQSIGRKYTVYKYKKVVRY